MEYLTDIMNPKDWQQVRSIYLEGIDTGNFTFETDAPNWDRWHSAHLQEHRLVVRDGDSILAWAAHRGKGIGSALLKAIINSTKKAGLWTLQGGILPEDTLRTSAS